MQFDHSAWKDILAKAKKEKKLVMLDAYTSWCGPCKWMAKNIFPLKEVGEFYNKNFVNAKIDMEKGEGLDIAKKYEVKNYPTFLFVDGDGKIVHRICGSREASAFIAAGEDAMSKDKTFMALEKNYKSPRSTAEAALAFFKAAQEACMDVDQDVVKYLAALKPSSLTDKSNYQLLMDFVTDERSAPFNYFLSHYDDFVALYPKNDIDYKVKSVFSASIKKAVRLKDEKVLAEIQSAYRKQSKAPVAYLDSYANMVKAKMSKDTSIYFKAIISFTNDHLMGDANQLNANAWDFYEKTDNKAYLANAEAWAKRSIELDPAYYNYDTYAAVLYKLGKYAEAKAAAGKAIDLGKKGGEEVKDTEELLTKINEKLKV